MPTDSTPTAPGLHYSIIERALPSWMKQAPPETHRAMRNWKQAPAWLDAAIQHQPEVARAWQQEHALHRQHQTQINAMFDSLPDLHNFAKKLLTEAISNRFGVTLDVERTYLVDARLIDSANARDGRQAVERATRSLLHCALHNFDPASALENGMDAPNALLKKSVILDHRRFMGTVPITNALSIPAEAFAELCRTLDIGRAYHDRVHAIYYPPATANQTADERALDVYQALGRAEVSAFRQSLHFARLKGDISETLYRAALAAPLDRNPTANEAQAVTFSLLKLWETELTGVVLITAQIQGQHVFALYIPEDSDTPLQEFPSLPALHTALRDRLQANLSYLDTHIPDRDKALIGARLQQRLAPLGWSTRGMHEPVPDPHATLHPLLQPFGYGFQGVMAFQKSERHEMDVLFHAIPTEIVDRRTAQAHRELIAGRALSALNIAGFFVPGLGEAMLAVCVSQLAYEVYEGIEAWHNDERDTAYGYMIDVIENVALMAALSAAAKALKGPGSGEAGAEKEAPVVERIPVETPSFIEELHDVEMPDGKVLLWKPDLTPYRSSEALPNGLEPDQLGLRQHQSQQWLMLEGHQYIVQASPASGEHRLVHPSRPRAYRPPLRHNGAGAWLLPLEQPEQWPLPTLLRRMGQTHLGISEQTALDMLRVSDISEDVLRRALAENQRLPALLEDTLTRFKMDQIVRERSSEGSLAVEFERAYRRLPASQLAGGELIQRVYPNLPTAVTDELLRMANTDELQALRTGKVPLRLAEEIRVYQQQIRLARAYEGLYLEGAQSWDNDRLIIHALEQLPGWPTETRLELREHRYWPGQRASVGPVSAHQQSVITRAEAGYIVHALDHADAPVIPHPTLFSALHSALPEAMQQLGIADANQLRHSLQRSPLLPRARLRNALSMQSVRPGYRSPMRLADGRLGYPLSGGLPTPPVISRQALLDAVAATGLSENTHRSAEQVLMTLARRGLSQVQILERLQVLLEQRIELQSRLDDWSADVSPAADQSAREHERLRSAIMQHWYDTALEEDNQHPTVLGLERVSLANIPLNLPASFTQRVSRLRLFDLAPENLASWAQHERLLQRLLRQFAHLEELEISRPYNPRSTPSAFLFSMPTITEQLPGLRVLTMTNQNISLTATDIDLLAGLPELRRLDLRGNRFAPNNSPSLHELSLDYLGLDNLQLSQWPIGLGSDALGRIAHVSLRNNNLRSLPAFLFNETEVALSHAVISLEGNDISEDHLQRLLLNENRLVSHINVDRSAALIERLERMSRERQQLREAIEGWLHASSSSNPLTQAIMEGRERIASAINHFWQNQERGLQYLRLQLEDAALEHVPSRLPEFFTERVNALTLTRMSGATSQLDDLLSRFPNITRLTIDAHVDAMQTLPSALSRLPRLAHLEFRNVGLEVDQPMIDTFAQLPHLTTLDISGNRMGTITQVPTSFATRLTALTLSNMGLQSWPSWCERLLPLELLDLSTNNISQLPDYILQNLENPMPISSIALFENPLALDTILRLRAYSESQHSFTFAMDANALLVTESSDEGSLSDHPHFPLAGDDTPRVELWALGNAAQNEALHDCWNTLEQSEDGGNLLRLAGRLRNAAPYVDATSQAAFCERVRLMLVTAATDEHMRPTMSAIAAEGLPDPVTGFQTCHDGALQAFNNIELLVMNSRVLIDAGDSLQALFKRLRQLYRMGQLELLASQRTAQGDHVSVRLAYRRELAAELDLPIADVMRFRSAAQLAHGEVANVLEQVRRRENSDGLLQYLMANAYWTDRLRAEHAERFSSIVERFGERVQELSALDLPLKDELSLQQGLYNDKEQEQTELLEELTRQYIARN
ncbi:dermonecrotic toxin domain-containing protein [Pseudomonas sp. NPDC090233]|uniref:dermonecrotic toxin domain-containing protein n=1 Tax=Pseudomonas sp. NPDC090233 TaxID=3364479 RepID=UPI00383BC6E6